MNDYKPDYNWPTLGLTPRRLIFIAVLILILAWAARPASAQTGPNQQQNGMGQGQGQNQGGNGQDVNAERNTGTLMTVTGGMLTYLGGSVLAGTETGAALVEVVAPVLIIIGGAAIAGSIIYQQCWMGSCQSK
jgi:hypothetical protein